METIKSLSFFFAAIENDGRISCTHIGVYAALLKYCIDNGNANPIHVFGREIMMIAKISDPNTYYRSLHRLSESGVIQYEPSFKRNQASKIYFSEMNDKK